MKFAPLPVKRRVSSTSQSIALHHIASPRASTLVKALARTFRWKRMLESGEYATIAEPAEREGIAPSCMTRVMRLTLLAPELVENILDGMQGSEVLLAQMLEPFPQGWNRQRIKLVQVV